MPELAAATVVPVVNIRAREQAPLIRPFTTTGSPRVRFVPMARKEYVAGNYHSGGGRSDLRADVFVAIQKLFQLRRP
jgi:hypothetical protein